MWFNRWYLILHFRGISSFIFTKHGQGFYLLSSSEYARVTLSSRNVTEPNCMVELKEGMRPEPEPEPVVVVEPQKEEAEEKKVYVKNL